MSLLSALIAGTAAATVACAANVPPEGAPEPDADVAVFSETDAVPESCTRIRESRVEDGGRAPGNCFGSPEGALRRAQTAARGAGGNAIHVLPTADPTPRPRTDADGFQVRIGGATIETGQGCGQAGSARHLRVYGQVAQK